MMWRKFWVIEIWTNKNSEVILTKWLLFLYVNDSNKEIENNLAFNIEKLEKKSYYFFISWSNWYWINFSDGF